MRWLAIAALLYSCAPKSGEKQPSSSPTPSDSSRSRTEYTCPMHPDVIRSTPGECPECGMELDVRS